VFYAGEHIRGQADGQQEVIAELDYLGGMMQDTFGVIGQSTLKEFDDLFEMDEGAGRLRDRDV
jgi:hypothetical protein